MEFQLNDKFSSFEELQNKIDSYCKANYHDLHRRDSRTLDAAVRQKRVVPERAGKNRDLKYYELSYHCVHGGRDNYKARGNGSRKCKTFQLGCPFMIHVVLSSDGNHLEVKKMNSTHANHDADEEEYLHLPKARKLNNTEVDYVEDMLSMGANKKRVQHRLQLETGKRVVMKDLTNIHNAAKRKHHTTKNDLAKCVDMLRNLHRCTVDISTDPDDNFCGLFIQDEHMRRVFDAYPEIIFFDATYKLLELQFPVYLFVVEDANGETEIVGLGFLVVEDAESLGWLVETFMHKNPSVKKTRLVMADKDLNERDTIKKMMPWAKVLICLFHTLKTFRREVTMDKMNLTSVMKENCLKYIEKMSLCKKRNRVR